MNGKFVGVFEGRGGVMFSDLCLVERQLLIFTSIKSEMLLMNLDEIHFEIAIVVQY